MPTFPDFDHIFYDFYRPKNVPKGGPFNISLFFSKTRGPGDQGDRPRPRMRIGSVGGFAMYQPDTNKSLNTTEGYIHQMICALAGRAAEETFFGDISDGAHDDLKKVTKIAYQMVSQLGMGKSTGNLNFHDVANEMRAGQVFPSQSTREKMEIEMKDLVDQQYKMALTIVSEKKDLIEKMANRLVEKETLLREDIIEILGERPFGDKMSYQAQTAASKKRDQEFELPPGLKHWEKSFRYRGEEGDQFENADKPGMKVKPSGHETPQIEKQ